MVGVNNICMGRVDRRSWGTWQLGTEVYVVESRLVTDGIGWVLAPTRVKYKITYYNRQYTKEVHHAVLKLTKQNNIITI